MRIILGSQSPFRRKALDILGLAYETIPSNFDETRIRAKNPFILARTLSEAKARTIGKREKGLIISADLFVASQGKIYEKPKTKKEAFKMLKGFSGNKIDIIGGLAVYNSKTDSMHSTAQKYSVKIRKLTDHEINDYIKRYPVTTLSAGFEGDGLLRFAERVYGRYPFLTGLPQNELILFLRKEQIRV